MVMTCQLCKFQMVFPLDFESEKFPKLILKNLVIPAHFKKCFESVLYLIF